MLNLKNLSKALIPLSLMTMTSAFADSEIADNCCPTPCCVPQPKKCIDCEAYNPQFYDLQCDWGVFVTADFLYWYARETNLEFAYQNGPGFFEPTSLATTRIWEVTTKHHYVKTKWDPGVRVGIGMNSQCDGWDLFLNWTYLHNHAKSTATAPFIPASDETPGFFIANPQLFGQVQPWTFGQINESLFEPVEFPVITGKWSLVFNQVDLEVGRKYWVSKCFVLRPYAGLRGAWVHTKFDILGSSEDPSVFGPFTDPVTGNTGTQGDFITVGNTFFKNKYWGVGFVGGLQPEFMLGNWCGCGNFSLYANVDAALIWGKFNARKADVALSSFVSNDITLGTTATIVRSANPVETDAYSRMQAIVDLGLGIRWEQHWCCDRYSTSIDLGWEHHYWADFGLYHRAIWGFDDTSLAVLPTPGVPGTGIIFDGATGSNNFETDLGFGGLVVRFRFDF